MAATLSLIDRRCLLTEQEVASIFRVSARTVRRWGLNGWLDPVRIGGTTRYREADIERFLAGGSENSEAQAVTPGLRENSAAGNGRDAPPA